MTSIPQSSVDVTVSRRCCTRRWKAVIWGSRNFKWSQIRTSYPIPMGLYVFWGFFNLDYERKVKLVETPKHMKNSRSTPPESALSILKTTLSIPKNRRRYCVLSLLYATVKGCNLRSRGWSNPDTLSRYLLGPEKFPNTWKREQAEYKSDELRQKVIVGIDVMAPSA